MGFETSKFGENERATESNLKKFFYAAQSGYGSENTDRNIIS